MELQDVCLMFHEPDCPGMITGNGDGQLTCAEWWAELYLKKSSACFHLLKVQSDFRKRGPNGGIGNNGSAFFERLVFPLSGRS
jgi:hypothetical protein